MEREFIGQIKKMLINIFRAIIKISKQENFYEKMTYLIFNILKISKIIFQYKLFIYLFNQCLYVFFNETLKKSFKRKGLLNAFRLCLGVFKWCG